MTASEGSLAVIVLAAGLGTRMKSELPKVLHPVCGRPLLAYALDAVTVVGAQRTVVVTAPAHDAVAAILPEGVERAIQAEQKGTGDAAAAGLAALGDFSGDVVVLNGDHPLMGAAFVADLISAHRTSGVRATLTAQTFDPAHYGRIVRDGEGRLAGIVEYRDATTEQRAISEANVGAYVFVADALRGALPRLRNDNDQGEYYLTDVIGLLLAGGEEVGVYRTEDRGVTQGVNSRVDLALVAAEVRRRLLEEFMLSGVTIIDPESTYVDWGVVVAPETIVHPQTYLLGATTIGCEIGPGSLLRDVSVADGARVVQSHVLGCAVGPGATVGPFTYLRPGTVLDDGAKAGAFVEVKNSHVGTRSKVPHLSYIGDTEIGSGSNIGAGTITANYDGFSKHRTTIGAGVRTGSDTCFVAPVQVGDGAYTGAGSVITKDIPAGALGIARGRQQNIEGYSERRLRRVAVEQEPLQPAGPESSPNESSAPEPSTRPPHT
jgi:bifunctional UDP-N-acetylglucosamine pyrophosphorylase/glucosamine-1-phosphate N-acetyltransferase